MGNLKKIENALPGTIKAKLDRIRHFLNEERASVMVGAGFSRNAEKESHVVMKDWNGLAEDIYEQLYSKRPTANDLAFKTPMRLASLLAANVGRSGLDQIIKDSLPDDLISPGKLHFQLMSLRWRDVFTTNYDTLLERAAEQSGRYYKVVTSKEMLLYKTPPRIIKLHGSFPDKTPFLMTEEEFRTYPLVHPEFVNTVRQALVESIFCLVGFSGDDPNFTSWQAWLRDVIGDYANPTYLITFDENYDDSFKKLMMSRGIEVLNLAEIRDFKDYSSALAFFFSYIGQREEEKWNAQVDLTIKEDKVSELVQQLKRVRESYPGWFVLPKDYYEEFRDMEIQFPSMQGVFEKITNEILKEQLLYELDWRADISLSYKGYEWYIKNIENCIARYDNVRLSEVVLELAISLLRLYRYHPEKNESQKDLISLLKDNLQFMTEGQKRRFYYYLSCNYLSVLDYESLELIMREWQPMKNDYDGIVYKALVTAEVKTISEASIMVGEALDRISKVLLKESSEELRSKKAALEFLSSFYEGEKRPKTPQEYSFLVLCDYFMGNSRQLTASEQEISHGFALGSVCRSWNLHSGMNPKFYYPYRYLQLCERFGFPYGMAENTVDYKLLVEIVGYLGAFDVVYTVPVALRSGSRSVAESAMQRSVLERITRKSAEALSRQLLELEKKNIPLDALKHRITSVILPMLCRLSTKVDGELKMEIFHMAFKHLNRDDSKEKADIEILYDAMMPNQLAQIIDFLFSQDININAMGEEFPYPKICLNLFCPTDKQIKIVEDGLKSNDTNIRIAALSRSELILKSNISKEQKNTIEDAIYEWRNNYNNDRYHWESLALVDAREREIDEVNLETKRLMDEVLTSDYIFSGSSLSISRLTDLLQKLSVLSPIITPEQRVGLMVKLSQILRNNQTVIRNDDSDRFMGGIRQFVHTLFVQIRDMVRRMNYLDSDKEACTALFSALSMFVDAGLPVRVTMELLNYQFRTVRDNKMRSIIEDALFSNDKKTMLDALDALLFHTKNGGNVQNVYQKIIHFCTTDITEKTYLYIDRLAYSDFSKLSKKTKLELGKMMISLYEKLHKCNLSTEYKADLAHSCVNMIKHIQAETSISSIKDAVSMWTNLINDPYAFDDVKRVYFE